MYPSSGTIFHRLSQAAHWFKMRDNAMEMARKTAQTLSEIDGHWRYSPDDPRFIKAVSFWVDRARRCHAFAMGRIPVIDKCVVIDGGVMTTFPMYVEGARCASH